MKWLGRTDHFTTRDLLSSSSTPVIHFFQRQWGWLVGAKPLTLSLPYKSQPWSGLSSCSLPDAEVRHSGTAICGDSLDAESRLYTTLHSMPVPAAYRQNRNTKNTVKISTGSTQLIHPRSEAINDFYPESAQKKRLFSTLLLNRWFIKELFWTSHSFSSAKRTKMANVPISCLLTSLLEALEGPRAWCLVGAFYHSPAHWAVIRHWRQKKRNGVTTQLCQGRI